MSEPLRLFADDRTRRRSRLLIGLFFLNWLAMGIVLVTTGSRNIPMSALAFVLGLIAMIACVGQLRGARLAEALPLVVVDDQGIHYRAFSSGLVEQLSWPEVDSVGGLDRRTLSVRRADLEFVAIPVSGLTLDDRISLQRRLSAELEHRHGEVEESQ